MFPNLREKYGAEPVITPKAHSEYRQSKTEGDAVEPPQAVIFCYSNALMRYFTDIYEGREVSHYYGDLFLFADTGHSVGVMGNFGIGAPTTAMLMDELIADGVEAFLSVGIAGSLDDSIEMGDFILCDKAIRDEGTSHHYVESEKFAHASESFTAKLKELLKNRDETFHVGPSWTTDAIYRETKAEIERYADEGVLTVDMEASAVFAVATHRGVDAGSIFVISDYLGLSEWEPKFHMTKEDLHHLGDTAKEMLTAYSNRRSI
ncbi:nucleoside phosphorylase [Haladaptatus caseinilyticus]|uniref:nucleoside phosphorylase n=1 Tax=Haladaptatus caseinilyticus TaxID=2993314 RepID=UPI00224B8D32|nr:nucleoside phosphorylase [Haladaptatus caseinilyticus]